MPLHLKNARSVTRYPSTTTATSNLQDSIPSRSSENKRSKSLGHGGRASTTSLNDQIVNATVKSQFLQRYEEMNQEIERLHRQSQCTGMDKQELEKVESELQKTKKDSKLMLQSQKALLEKIVRQDKKQNYRRFFWGNHEKRVRKLKKELNSKLGASLSVDAELHRLERQSVALRDVCLPSMDHSGSGGTREQSGGDTMDPFMRLESLKREKQSLLCSFLHTVPSSDAQEIQARISMHVSEMRACECIRNQVEKCAALYREALQKLCAALSDLTSPEYTSTMKEFVANCYPLAIEAGRAIEAASLVIQPDTCRRYTKYAPELMHVRAPKFPQAISDFARRATRPNSDTASGQKVEEIGKLKMAEKVLILMQRFILDRLEIIERWSLQISKDWNRSESSYRKLENQLQQEIGSGTG
uniref:Uncharacterized protein AlNc14C156G7660 n=1 Tax=Albugo laibachii Nc14 TaxID=890382 RepID=F0WMH0_9STRA|nr:conserved hypothetical protein [Albugo laibachii Nc14]|eukprot:CCA22502.1 conserved hypothetical protein [Albugo laibachii Nc14]